LCAHEECEFRLGVVAHAFDPSTWEAEAGGFLSLRPAWSTE
jgi:major histocompatibility complex class I